ncbi:MAG: AAA family ATPase [Chloroflexota bacterium]
MSTTIAVAGKGGVGKTTIAAMVVKYLIQNYSGAILAIDADPSSNFHLVLGVDLEWTIGDIREEMLNKVKSSLAMGGAAMGSLSGGISKREYLDYEVRSSITEGKRFDLIAMGRPEGPGCYCAVNHNLREVMDAISSRYSYTVIDNEAGMEHLSRRTTRDVEHLFIISDPTRRGLLAAQRIAELRNELDINIANTYLILNRLNGEVPHPLTELIQGIHVPFLGVVPTDEQLAELEFSGRPFVDLSTEATSYLAIKKMLDQLELEPG